MSNLFLYFFLSHCVFNSLSMDVLVFLLWEKGWCRECAACASGRVCPVFLRWRACRRTRLLFHVAQSLLCAQTDCCLFTLLAQDIGQNTSDTLIPFFVFPFVPCFFFFFTLLVFLLFVLVSSCCLMFLRLPCFFHPFSLCCSRSLFCFCCLMFFVSFFSSSRLFFSSEPESVSSNQIDARAFNK